MIEWQQILAVIAFVGLIVVMIEEFVHRRNLKATEKNIEKLLDQYDDDGRPKHD